MLSFNKMFGKWSYLNKDSRVLEEESKTNENENAEFFTPYFLCIPPICLQ